MLIGAGADTTDAILQGFFKIMALHQDAVREAQEGEEKKKISLVLFEISFHPPSLVVQLSDKP